MGRLNKYNQESKWTLRFKDMNTLLSMLQASFYKWKTLLRLKHFLSPFFQSPFSVSEEVIYTSDNPPP